MIRSGRQLRATPDQALVRIKDVIDNPSPQAEAAVRWALSRLDEANVPDVVHGVVATLTGNSKVANRARKAASRAVRRAERKLRPASRGIGKAWLLAGLLAAAAAGILLWRTFAGYGEPKAFEGAGQPVDASDVHSAE